MNKEKFMHYLPWGLALFIGFVFVQSLFFKFAAAGFAAYGGYTIGTIELIATILILIRKTQVFGAALAFGVISGAIFFHLFTPLGVSVIINEAGDRDGGQLFAMAVLVSLSAAAVVYLRRADLAAFFGKWAWENRFGKIGLKKKGYPLET